MPTSLDRQSLKYLVLLKYIIDIAACFTESGISATSIFHLNSILTANSACWRLLQLGRNGENAFRLIKMLLQMAHKCQFSTDDSVNIVPWWGKLKDLDKVRWHYAKEKGIERFPRKLLDQQIHEDGFSPH